MLRSAKDKERIDTLKAANEALKSDVQRLKEDRKENLEIKRDLIAKVERLENEKEKLQRDSRIKADEIKKLRADLREQTEADILLNALKAVGIIKEDKPEKPDYFAENSRLQDQLRNIQPQGVSQGDSLSSLFGGVFR